VGHRERITARHDLGQLARDSERRLEPAASETRRRPSPYSVPWLVVTYEALRAMRLDNRDAFVLSLIDGRATVETIVDMAGMPEDETVGILGRLLHVGAIELRDPTGR
jgi:hypothetical protein